MFYFSFVLSDSIHCNTTFGDHAHLGVGVFVLFRFWFVSHQFFCYSHVRLPLSYQGKAYEQF